MEGRENLHKENEETPLGAQLWLIAEARRYIPTPRGWISGSATVKEFWFIRQNKSFTSGTVKPQTKPPAQRPPA
jgi:hypothetical protein